ncbi:RnfABCDGE type electron transport complex subunit D [Marivita sp. XM-24bin2]|jgi:Na+-transporting NADH:ubiquinone oxidoreductase subunit B|uniref:RnfABCDGE type electron transport complex subunit D n=1 Tax=unclassified Marivita TaxID=2632480 RepID=UPI000D7AD178|nr:RnfABCDGE type electron transport complex subunit D [Marivita sp. XM-24bin2]MCR9110671.1 RnfABCDGE type electron transport complex subunit D [Paracoccaceae bacterium]PWL33777.1 MAG: NADH-quinone reductase [Marivita sp. XM-24bin2]
MNRGLWTRETVVMLLLAAYLPLALFWLWFGGIADVHRYALVLLVLAIWQLVFLLARAQPVSLSAVFTALAIAMLVPEDLGAFRLILGISFGAVMGELVFGGWGRNVVNPATVTLSFLGFGFPALPWPDILVPVAWAAIPTALIGLITGAMPAGVVLGAALGAGVAVPLGLLPSSTLPAAGVVLVLLVADPVTSATTSLGRWLNGLLYLALVILFANGWSGAAPVQLAVAAALLTSLAAPVLDEIALMIWYAERRRRHGRD